MNESTRKTFSYSMYFPFCCFLCDGPSLTGPLTDTNILKHNDVGTIKEWMLLKEKRSTPSDRYTIKTWAGPVEPVVWTTCVFEKYEQFPYSWLHHRAKSACTQVLGPFRPPPPHAKLRHCYYISLCTVHAFGQPPLPLGCVHT